jgi:hypothetical protein
MVSQKASWSMGQITLKDFLSKLPMKVLVIYDIGPSGRGLKIKTCFSDFENKFKIFNLLNTFYTLLICLC